MPGVGLRGSRETVEEKQSRGQREARSCTARKETELPGAREKAACTLARAKGSEILKLIFDSPLLTRAEWTRKQALPALSRSRHQAGRWGGGGEQKAGALHSGPLPTRGSLSASSLRLAWAASSSASPSEQGQSPDASSPVPSLGGKGGLTLQK